ncbi:hypothetical protein ACWDRB_65300 [Nonomuraea sp. NPDC003707]
MALAQGEVGEAGTGFDLGLAKRLGDLLEAELSGRDGGAWLRRRPLLGAVGWRAPV